MKTELELVLERTTYSHGCWEVGGSRWTSGYGRVKGKGAHRVVYESEVGKIPDGLDLDHLCRNRACCNPLHLEPVTRSENIKRGVESAPAWQRAKTHCKWGHPFDAANTSITKKGGRRCKTCDRLAHQKRGQ